MIWPSKDPAEIITVTFDFSDEIGAATISSTDVTITVANGTDPAVASMLNGAEVVSGALVYQSVMLGVNGNNYVPRCEATLSDGRVLVRAALLPVRVAG